MQCVILAGGLGTRMRHLTGNRPKSLLPIHGRPFLDYQLKWLAQTGVSQVLLCLGYGGDQVRAYIGDGQAWHLPIVCLDEGATLQGTGGALRLAVEAGVLNEKFLVTYGDSFLPIDFSKVWQRFQGREEPALMTVYRNEQRWGASNACLEGDRVTRYDKRAAGSPEFRYIDYGLSALRRSLIESELLSRRPADLAELFNRLSLRGELAGMEVQERFYEIGSPEGLAEFSAMSAAFHV